MKLSVAVAQRGTTHELTFDGSLAASHGGYFYLVSATGENIAGLWSNRNEAHTPGYTLDLDTFVILDFAVTDGGPDVIKIPDNIASGRYRICTANSRPSACAGLIVL